MTWSHKPPTRLTRVSRDWPKRPRTNGLWTRLAGALVAAAVLASCGDDQRQTVVGALRLQLAKVPRACIPIGWSPVPVDGSYYPGADITTTDDQPDERLAPPWIAFVADRKRDRPDIRPAVDVVEALVHHGMLSKRQRDHGTEYTLTMKGLASFYNGNSAQDNSTRQPYFCYESRVLKKIFAIKLISSQSVHVEFSWSSGPAAPWASDDVLQQHTVLLGPQRAKLDAHLVRYGDEWYVDRIRGENGPLPTVKDSTVWPTRPTPLAR